MLRRVYRVLEFAVIGSVAVVGVLLAVAVLRLMAGPVDLDFLKSRLAQEFDTPAGKLRLRANRIYAEWGSLKQPMRLVAVDLHVTDQQMNEIATVPSVALTFEPRSVIRGLLLPRSIVVQRPTLNAEIDREGGMLRRVFADRDPGSQGQVVDLLVEQLLAETNRRSFLGQLDTVEVEGARLTVRDLPSGMIWVAPDARASLKRDAAGVIIAADARFSNGGSPVDVALSGTYGRDRSRIYAEAKVDGLKPSMLADLSPDAAILRGVDIALSGRLEIEADGAGTIRTVAIDVTAGAGTITLPGLLPVAHKVRSVSAHAAIDAATHSARISNVDIDLGLAKISIIGEGIRTEQGQRFSGRAEVRDIPIDHLRDYWPLGFAEGGREWALANLSSGKLDVAAEFGLSVPGNDLSQLTVTRNVTFLDYRGMTMHYMRHMPELEGVSGRARYENGTLHFDVDRGSAVGLRVAGATIDMNGLSGPPPHFATIQVPIAGSASDTMALLARAKLELPKDALYEPKRLAGEAAIKLTLSVPLIKELTVGEIDIKAEASLVGFSLKNAIGNVDFTDAVGHVAYANSQLQVTGQGKMDGSPAQISWREMFSTKAPYRRQYELKGSFPASLMTKAGFVSPEPYISGLVGTTLRYQVYANGTADLTAKLDLKAAKIAVSQLAWAKEAGSDGSLDLSMKVLSGGKLASADFDVRGNGLGAKGQVRFVADNSVRQVSLQTIAIGRSDLAVDWRRDGETIDLLLKGRALDWARVRQVLKAREEAVKSTPTGANTPREKVRMSFQIDRLLVQRGTLGSVNGKMELAGDRIASADISVSGGKGTAFKVSPTSEGGGPGRKVALYVPDLGLLLGSAGWLHGLSSSFLDFSGQFDDRTAEAPLVGKLQLGPYRLEKVAPQADIGSLNSTIEGLSRAGDPTQQFNGLDADISKKGDRIDIRNGRTSGRSIGLTAAGRLDLSTETAHLRGVVVPAFELNNLLSNLPLLGPLLTGGKNSGLFAIAYRLDGPFDELKLDVNMMSALTPGALRELLTGPLEGGPPTSTPPPQSQAP